MTRDEQIATILELLAPPCADRDAGRSQIDHVLVSVDRNTEITNTHKIFGSKRGKADMRRFRTALIKVNDAYQRLGGVRRWFSLAETAYIVGSPTIIDREIAKVDGFLVKKSTPKRDAVRAKAATEMAYNMLLAWGHKPSKTSGGLWVKLAQAFDGNGISEVAIFRHIRTHKPPEYSRPRRAV